MDQSIIILFQHLHLRVCIVAAQISLFIYHFFYANNLSDSFDSDILFCKYLHIKDIVRDA